jgi:hypothetical protein
MSQVQDYLARAQESLAGAESELAHRRFNRSARGAYYACFQAAIAALLAEGIFPQNPAGLWGHDHVQREAAQAVRRAQEFVREVTVRLAQSGEP